MTREECCRQIPPLCKILCKYYPKGINNDTGNGNPPDNPYDSPIVFYYGFTELNTITQDPVQADYLAAVNATSTNNGKYYSTILHNANVEVSNFFATSLKVLFIKVPKSEPVFTTWSEENNPLQQNQPIDTTFKNNSVIFIIDSNDTFNTYVTRSQTNFVGKLILSR